MPVFAKSKIEPRHSVGTSSYIFYPETVSGTKEVEGFLVQTWVGIGSMGNQRYSLSKSLNVHSQAFQIQNVEEYCSNTHLPTDTEIVKLPYETWTKLTVLLGAWSGLNSGSIALHDLFRNLCSGWNDLWEQWTPEGLEYTQKSGITLDNVSSIESIYLYLLSGANKEVA